MVQEPGLITQYLDPVHTLFVVLQFIMNGDMTHLYHVYVHVCVLQYC